MRVFCALWESEPMKSKHVESPIQNLSGTRACARPAPHPHRFCRCSADPPSTCSVLLRPTHEALSLEAYN